MYLKLFLSLKEINKVLHLFIGQIDQVPPKNFSAKKLNGKRCYDLARNNEEFELKPQK